MRALLAYLAMHRSAAVSREGLLEVFWPEVDEERARASLKTATWSIRRALRVAGCDPEAVLQTERSTLRWIAPIDVDTESIARATSSNDIAELRAAIDLYHGEFLPGDYDEWPVAERERAGTSYEVVLGRCVALAKDPAAAELLVARNPYDEAAYDALVDAAIAMGRPLAALRWVERCEAALLELGARPSDAFAMRAAELRRSARTPASELRIAFAGRQAERDTLQAAFASDAGALILISGDAGIGKTTLLERCAGDALEAGLGVVRVRSVDNDPRTYGPWGDLFEALSGERFAEFVTSASGEGGATLAAVLQPMLRGRSAIFVDDAHLLGGEALRLLPAFAGVAAAAGHIVAIALRDEGRQRIRALFEGSTPTELRLRALGRDELLFAVRRSAGEALEPLAEELYERSAGHPLFFFGLLDMCTREGRVVNENGAWKIARGPAAHVALPENIRSFIETRLRARGTATCDVACALALEPEATPSDLAGVLAFEEPLVLDAIDDLLGLGILREPPSGPQFEFTHDLVREVAAGLIHAGRRVRLHAAFARRLEASARSESLRCARHEAASGQLAAAGRDFLRAAEEALEVNAWSDALERCESGLACLRRMKHSAPRDAVIARLHVAVARAHVCAGDDAAAVADAQEAVAYARRGNDGQTLLAGLAAASTAYVKCHRMIEALDTAEEAAALARASGNTEVLVEMLLTIGSVHCHRAARDAALGAGREAYALAVALERSETIAEAAGELLRTEIVWWNFAEAARLAEAGASAAARAGWLADASFHISRALLAYYLERFDDLDRLLERASDTLAQRTERRWHLPHAGLDRLKARFFADYIAGVAACVRGDADGALATAVRLSPSPLYASSYMIRNNVLHLHVRALLDRNARGDARKALALAREIVADELAPGVLDFSTSKALAYACAAARCATNDVAAALAAAEADVNRAAQATPLECDRAYAYLAAAADDAGDAELASRASQAADVARTARGVAAGSMWGGQSHGGAAKAHFTVR
jgi:DNA-binding SARP family transcriptional activator